MGWGATARLGAIACALTVTAAGMAAASAAASPLSVPAANTNATVSVLHALPAGLGADVVDVYAGRTLLVDNLTPGELATVQVRAGSYDLVVLPDGGSPGTTKPLLSAPGTRVPSGANLTVTANLSTAGRPVLTVFTNDTTTVGQGKGRLTVRHIAEAPPIDVRTRGSVLLAGVRNAKQASVGLTAGDYRIDIVRAGTRRAVLEPSTVTIRNRPGTGDMGTNTIVYVWGSAADGTLDQAVQNVRIDLR